MKYSNQGLMSAEYRRIIITTGYAPVNTAHAVSVQCCEGTLLATSTVNSFSAKLLANQLVLSSYHCKGLLYSSHRTLLLPLLNFMKILSACISNLPGSLWIAILPSRIFTAPPNLVSFKTFRGSSSSYRLLIKIFNRIYPRIDPQETPVLSTLK